MKTNANGHVQWSQTRCGVAFGRPGSMADDKYVNIKPRMVLSSAHCFRFHHVCRFGIGSICFQFFGLRYYLNLIGNASCAEWVAVRFMKSWPPTFTAPARWQRKWIMDFALKQVSFISYGVIYHLRISYNNLIQIWIFYFTLFGQGLDHFK